MPPAGHSLRHDRYRLANGMTVILHEDRTLPIACVNIWYQVGSKDELPGRSGFAHLFEHLMFMGTERVPGSQFDVLMERGGGANNATTSYDRTNYFSSGPSPLLPTLLWLEADRMEDLGRMMTQDKLDRQRDVVRNERRQSYENRPYGRADLVVNEQVFPPGHPYHIPVIGTHEDLQAATVADVQQFFDTFYVPSNASLVVAGDFEPEETKALIEQLFGTLPSRPVPLHAASPPPVTLPGVQRVTLSDDVQLARLTLAWPSPPLYGDGDADMDVLAGVLAQGKASRLWTRLVRDEKLCAEVTSYQASRQLGSVFEVECLCPPEVDLARVEAIIDEELARLHADGPREDELRRVRNQIEHAMLRRLESIQDRADQLNSYHCSRDMPDSLQWDIDRYEAVSPATARARAREVLRLDARVAVRVLTENPRSKRPAAATGRPFAFPLPESWRLDNGVAVHFWRRPQLPLVSAHLLLPRGAACDPEPKAGLSQLALDMLSEGTKRRTAPAFADALEMLGARLGFVAHREESGASLRSTRASFPDALGLLAEAITEPALDPAEWERMRNLHLQDLQQRDDDPAQVAGLVSMRRLFGPGHPMSWPIDGDADSVGAVALDDVRTRLGALVRPEGAVLLLAGDLERTEAERLVAERLGAWSGSGTALEPPPLAPAGRKPLRTFLLHRPGAVQTVVRFAWEAPPFAHPDRVALMLLNTILGGSFTSRLNQNLREKNGYTYGVGSRLMLMPSLGLASAQSSVRADVTGASVREFLKEFDAIREGNIEESEREKAAATLRNRKIDVTAGLDGLLSQADEVLTAGLPFSEIDRSLKEIDAVTTDVLNAIAPVHVTPREGVLVLVGDRDVVLPQLQDLDIPAPVEVDVRGRDARA